MKKITLNISDEVFKDLSQAMTVRILVGASHGIVDETVGKIIDGIRNEQKEIAIVYKKEMENAKESKDSQ